MLKLSEAFAGWSPQSGARSEDPVLLLAAVWPELVGDEIARHSRPLRLTGDALSIITRSSAWSQELSYLSERILASIRARLPNAGIEELRFRVGKLPVASALARTAASARRGESAEPGVAATAHEALGRLRERVTALQRAKRAAGWKECSGCGAFVAPGGATLCIACTNTQTQAAARLLFDAPWLGYRGTAAIIGGLTAEQYDAIRRRLLAHWLDVLSQARASGRLSPDGRERALASSYVVLASELPPDEIRPATVRNVLGDALHDYLFGTEVTSETNGQ